MKTSLPRRVASGMRVGSNWAQLLRFAAVGAVGYVVNLAVFALAAQVAGAGHRTAATVAFAVAVTNNFVLNRGWTFDARADRKRFQAARFVCVSVAAFLISLAVLEVLVSGVGTPALLAQAVAVAVATPFNFLGNRLWSFRRAS
jgi:putative flippase GtrA